jgi:hypothetical protein
MRLIFAGGSLSESIVGFITLHKGVFLSGTGTDGQGFSSFTGRCSKTRPNQRADACRNTYSGTLENILDSNKLACCFSACILFFCNLGCIFSGTGACWRRAASRPFLETPETPSHNFDDLLDPDDCVQEFFVLLNRLFSHSSLLQ